jgi:hypothetical protein
MQLKKRLERLEAELLPEFERRKQQLLEQQQYQPTPIFKHLTPDDYRWRPYHPAWIRKQHGIVNPRADAIDRYFRARLVKEMKEKHRFTDSQIADVLEGRSCTLADRDRRSEQIQTAGGQIEPTNLAEAVVTPTLKPTALPSSTISGPSGSSSTPGPSRPLVGGGVMIRQRRWDVFSGELTRGRR